HGPRVVNNVVIKQSTVVNVSNITYHNTRVNNAVVATTRERFGRGPVHDAPVRVTQTRELRHLGGALPVKPGPASLLGGAPSGIRPPEQVLSRPVITTRPPRESTLPWRGESSRRQENAASEPRYVPAPGRPGSDLPRPEFGAQTGAERARPALPPRFEERRREAEAPVTGNRIRERTESGRVEPVVPRAVIPEAAMPPRNMREAAPVRAVQERERERIAPEPRRIETAPSLPRVAPEPARRQERVERTERERADLPGQPANRMFRGQDRENGERRRSQQ
ncbi:MAG: hypothetical protein Q8O25_03315, partial [Sulfurisoma sp.]|nr:hypothetical protein [Sulfurisoma sp.]